MDVTAIYFIISSLLVASLAITVEVDNTIGNDDPLCYGGNGGPCKTLDYALTNSLASFTTIMLHQGTYSLKAFSISFYNVVNVTIVGDGYDTTVIECDFGTGLGFFDTYQLVLANFTLIGGGKLMNSTLINRDVIMFRTALHLVNCSDVTIDGLIITNSTGTGMTMYHVTGNVHVINSVFQFNIPLEAEDLPGGGGVSVAFTYCKSHIVQPCDITTTTNAVYIVRNCSFISNMVAFSNDTTSSYHVPIASVHRQFGHGGGLHFSFRSKAQNNSVIITGCKFRNNSALWGGGLSIEMFGNSTGNNISLDGLLFQNNHVQHVNTSTTGGGAVRIAVLLDIYSNYNTQISVTDCVFIANFALFGGGISIETNREVDESTTFISTVRCKWIRNVGRLGSALDIYAHPYPIGETANFIIDSCSFNENTNHYTNKSVKLLGLGTLYSWSVPIVFKNKNTFISNYGSALVGVSTLYHFYSGAVFIFENNTAENGGAVALFESSYIVLYDNIQLTFTSNVATGKGGAIYIVTTGQRDLVSNYHCPIMYQNPSVSPYKWKERNVTVVFSRNTAINGNSIFATTLFTCVWGGLLDPKEISYSDISQVFFWNGSFLYDDSTDVTDLDNEISSEITYVKNVNPTYDSIPPGRLYQFNFIAENERNVKADAVYFVTSSNNSVAVVDQLFTYSINGYTRLYGPPGSNIDLQMVTGGNIPLAITVNIQLANCPPGFYPNDAIQNNTSCECSVNVPGQEYLGIVECDNLNLVAKIRSAHFATYDDFDGVSVLLTSDCPTGYCNDSDAILQLPSNASNPELDRTFCRPKNRTGRLCGKCADGHYLYINSQDYMCGKCMDKGIEFVLIIVCKFIPLTIFILMIGILNISLVNGPLNSFLLFSQLLPYMDVYAGGRIDVPYEDVSKIYGFLYGVWNLNFIEVLISGICVFRTDSALSAVVLLYYLIVVIFIILLVISIYALGWLEERPCIRRSKLYHKYRHCFVKENPQVGSSKWYHHCLRSFVHCKRIITGLPPGQQGSFFRIHGLYTVVILCYTKITAIAFDLLTATTLYGPGKDESKYTLKVFWLDGTLKYTEHWYYILISSVLLIIMVSVPFVLFIFPWCRRTSKYYDIVQECYKNNNFIVLRFSAIYFVYRLAVLAAYAFTPSTDLQYLWQGGLFLFMLVIQCCFQPYKNSFYNIVDGCMFFILTLISMLSFYQLYVQSLNASPSFTAFVFQTILVYLPIIYFIVLAAWKRYIRHIKNHTTSPENISTVVMAFYRFTENNPSDEEIRRGSAKAYSGSRHIDNGTDDTAPLQTVNYTLL